MKLCGRKPSRNLLLDGYEEVADFIARRIKDERQAHHVHVANTGAVRITPTNGARASELPAEWLVGTYPYKGLRVEFIEDDLLLRQRELAA